MLINANIMIMMNNIREELVKTFEYFGARKQRDKLCEEVRELQDELFIVYEFGDESENLLNEGIDVISIVLQFLYEYGYDDDEIINTLKERVERTAIRRDDGYYG